MEQVLKYCLCIAIVVLTTSGLAQDITIMDNRSKGNVVTYDWYATTQVGISIPNKTFAAFSDHGFRTMTGVELQQSDGFFYRIGYEITLLRFHTRREDHNYTIVNKGSRSILGGYVDLGYKFIQKKTDVYFFVGYGAMILNGPATTFDPGRFTIITKSQSQVKGSFHAGIGFSFKLRRKLIPFVEAQYFALAGRTMINNTLLDGANVSIGFRAPLRKNNR